MLEDFQEQQRRRTVRMRSIMDFTMGAIMFLAGVFFLIYGELGIKLRGREHSTLDYALGALFVLYGIWRIYRGYKKDYFQ
jgi:small neutral amino acid transporter SnatA (MarC family)